METYSRIAVFRALHLGDMLCIIPTVRAIRSAYPTASITLIGLPWQQDFVNRFPRYFNAFIEFPGWPGLPERIPDTYRIPDFLHEIQRHEFELILQMQGNGLLTNSLCMLWNGSRVAGLRKSNEWAPDENYFPVSEDSDHEILRFFKLLDCLGIPQQGSDLEFPILAEENDRYKIIQKRLQLQHRKYICIHPGARDPRRRWPVENFAALANEIEPDDFTIVLTGSSEEKSLLLELQRRIYRPTLNIVELLGHVSAGELASILDGSALLVSNDTGVSHIAAALKIPSIILFSRYSHYERWRPLNSSRHLAIPFEKNEDRHYVLRCLLEMLENAKQQTSRESTQHLSQSMVHGL